MISFELVLGITFVAFIATECWLSMRMHLDNYDRHDALANGSIAVMGALLNIAFKGIAFYYFRLLYDAAPVKIANGWVSLVVLFLLTDLLYYAFHYLGHKSRFFWASHVIHHSSEKFNLTTSLRSPITNSWFRFIFSTPLPLMGFDPAMIVLMDSVVLIYTFFIHTELVGKLGPLEYFLNTPSHHRVHHGRNPKYIDKNFGGVLILWDRLFGTFQAEVEKPEYGLTKPLRTHNPLQIVFHEWVDMTKDVLRARTARERWLHLLGRPGISIRNYFLHLRLPVLTVVARAVAFAGITFTASTVHGQSINELIAQGQQLEKVFKDEAAFEKYQTVLMIEPNYVVALVRSSRMLCNMGGRSKDKKFKKAQALKAKGFALRAIKLDGKNTDAHLCYILSLGILSEMADGPREKLENSKVIRKEADYILSIDPNYAPAYYILGKWHHALASLNSVERLFCNMFFGGVPDGASMDEAIRNYEKAIQLWPDYILFHYSKAMSLHWQGDNKKSALALEKALSLAPKDLEDPARLEKCRKLLTQVKSVNL
jgi:sterol desaturase/sphingolipid hydroxylase (fatty acid hydroxylase superfamily)